MICSLAQRCSISIKRHSSRPQFSDSTSTKPSTFRPQRYYSRMAAPSDQPSYEERLRKRIDAGNAKTKVNLEERHAFKASQGAKLSQVDDPKRRYQLSAQVFIDSKEEHHMNHPTEKYCPRCWSVVRGCICANLKPIQTRHRYINWLHYKEIWRTTNTGTLLPLTCDNARSLIYGREQDDEDLERVLKDEAATTVFLYPSPDSITIREFFERQRTPEQGPIEDWSEFLKTVPVLNVIGIDSTWSLSRAMSGSVPSTVARVHLANPPKFSISNMRNQSSQGRITTAEAFAAAMKELGETEEAVETLFHNLKARCDSTLTMSGLNAKSEPSTSVANREIREQANREKKAERRAAKAKAAEEAATSSPPDVSASSSEAPETTQQGSN